MPDEMEHSPTPWKIEFFATKAKIVDANGETLFICSAQDLPTLANFERICGAVGLIEELTIEAAFRLMHHPDEGPSGFPGDLRDYFAAKCLDGFTSNLHIMPIDDIFEAEEMVKNSYKMADMMLEARNAKTSQ